MPTLTDHRPAIAAALRDFQSRPLKQAARKLMTELGYKSDRTVQLSDSRPQAFLDFIRANARDVSFNEAKALCSDWKSADILFQLTDEELAGLQCRLEIPPAGAPKNTNLPARGRNAG